MVVWGEEKKTKERKLKLVQIVVWSAIHEFSIKGGRDLKIWPVYRLIDLNNIIEEGDGKALSLCI